MKHFPEICKNQKYHIFHVSGRFFYRISINGLNPIRIISLTGERMKVPE
jgi:hypothetical protein